MKHILCTKPLQFGEKKSRIKSTEACGKNLTFSTAHQHDRIESDFCNHLYHKAEEMISLQIFHKKDNKFKRTEKSG